MMQKAVAHEKQDEGMTSSSDTSIWSSPSGSYSSSDDPQYTSVCEDKADAIPSFQWQGSKRSRRLVFGNKAHGGSMQKTNPTTNCYMVSLPPIRSLETPKPSLKRIRELENKVWSLQQQLCESRAENKLLKNVQHRHMVALQHFQDSENSIAQIETKHKNEARALQHLLRETRTCRDNLARQLRSTEDKMLHTREALQHLQLLSQDHNLLEREELTLRLAKASAELEEKDKKILDMEKNFELCQASFKRQIVTEQRKMKEARKISIHLQQQVYQLTRELAYREREMGKRNIYSHRFQNGSSNRGRENKMVQTDGLGLLPIGPASLLENEYSEHVQRLEQQESSVNWGRYGPAQKFSVIKRLERKGPAHLSLKENHQDDAKISANCSDIRSSDNSPEPLNEEDCIKEKEEPEPTRALNGPESIVKHQFSDICSDESPENENNGEAPQVQEETRQTQHESTMAFTLERCLNRAAPKRKESRIPRIRSSYTFKQTTENLHCGRPAYSTEDLSPQESSEVEILSRIPELHLPDEKTDGGGAHSS
ncbi:lebercilin-like protein [Astatotilapia calliptera]|uniref:lebercilin-like protein n=1 Tax=Astatotilapia calliptera TaxID=8154 RepID=UPI000E40FD7A|nr:lebercilin-like protein [Astatotilapia calliptera]